MRILHTSDWHLGHTLHDLPREWEHQRFLDWLIAQTVEQQADALLIAGDVFETANPPASAQARWYRFLAKLRATCPDLDVVVIGGNHDSAGRLDAPRPILEALRVQVVGGLPRAEDGAFSPDDVLVPLRDARGEIAAWCVAIPYLRTADLPRVDAEGVDLLVEGVRAVYAQALAAARARREPGQALVAMGHCFMVGGALSALSERRILGGNEHALPVDLFPEDLAYVALGHLHKAQRVGGREGVRYSGSPLPLSLTEADYRHQVLVVDLEGEALGGITELPIPRAVDMLRLPPGGPRPFEEVEPLLRALPPAVRERDPLHPWLEVRVSLSEPRSDLRQAVEEALTGRAAKLVKLTVSYPGRAGALADRLPSHSLRELQPGEVFRLLYAERFDGGEPPEELRAAFHELVEAIQESEGERPPRQAEVSP